MPARTLVKTDWARGNQCRLHVSSSTIPATLQPPTGQLPRQASPFKLFIYSKLLRSSRGKVLGWQVPARE